MGRISKSPRYVIDITGLNPLSLGESEGVVNSEKLEKLRYFQLKNGSPDPNEISYLEGTHVSELLF